jgi:hypothetical protein
MGQPEVLDALRRYVLRPDEEVEKVAETSVRTTGRSFEIGSPDWLVRREPWVRDAVVVRHDADAHGTVYRYGFVWISTGELLFLNDVATTRRLGGRLDAWGNALGFAQILAELHYSVAEDGEATVYPFWDGRLIGDPSEFLRAYPSVDPALVPAPRVGRDGLGVIVEFGSYYRYLLDHLTSGVDILTWTVASDGQAATWTRHLVAEGVVEP